MHLQAFRDPESISMATRIGTCNRVINILLSLIFGLGVCVCGFKALEEAEGGGMVKTAEEKFYGITVGAIVTSFIQSFTNIPYAILSHVGGKRTKQYSYYMWVIYHVLASMGSCALFYMMFYMVDQSSLDLRKTFWQQFKFKIDKVTTYQGTLVALTDCLGLNSIFMFLIVIYPSASRVWNRDSD